MVVVMGHFSALSVSVSTAAAVTSAVSSPHSPARSSFDDVHGGHGLRPVPQKVTTRFGSLLKVVAASSSTPWRRELSFRVGGKLRTRNTKDVRVEASSSDETSGEKGQVNTENVPEWAKPNSEELPPWARSERPASQDPVKEVPFAVYLLGSTLVAIAAVGSVFEFFNKNPVFGVIPPDSPFYTPILGFFAITGLPTAGFLFYKSIQLANKASEEADREDGYRR